MLYICDMLCLCSHIYKRIASYVSIEKKKEEAELQRELRQNRRIPERR